MSYEVDQNAALSADQINSGIREPGKYKGVITRAEALVSGEGTKGLGISFKADGGATADYLDIYTHKADGTALMGAKTVSAIMACTRQSKLADGTIQCEKWNKQTKKRDQVTVKGYPALMGKRIGFLLQKEYGTHNTTGAETEKMVIFGVFSADTEMTASEILDKKTSPEQLSKMVDALAARPVRDNRKNGGPTRSAAPSSVSSGHDDPFGEDLSF